jgi:hypothetical protein
MQGPPTTPTEDDDASIPTEHVRNGPNLIEHSQSVRRKAAKRTLPWKLTADEIQLALSPPQDEDIRETKRPRLEEPVPISTDEVTTANASHDATVALSPPDAAHATAEKDDANADPVMETQPNARATGATGRWTLVEDAKLTSAVVNTRKMKLGKNCFSIAALVPTRTQIQCQNRWYNADLSIDWVTRRTGKWKDDEDIKLKAAVQKHGDKDWVAIAALVPRRTRRQCYQRWCDSLDPSIDGVNGCTGLWKGDEIIKLKEALQKVGDKDWVAIAALVPGRTKKQCWNRWRKFMDPNRSTVRGKEHGTLNKVPALGRDPHPN